MARPGIPGIHYDVSQRGNRRQQTPFEDGDHTLYRALLGDAARNVGASGITVTRITVTVY